MTAIVAHRDALALLLPEWLDHGDARVRGAAAACVLNLAQVTQYSASESTAFGALSSLCHTQLLARKSRDPVIVRACCVLALSADMPAEAAEALRAVVQDAATPDTLRAVVVSVLKLFNQ